MIFLSLWSVSHAPFIPLIFHKGLCDFHLVPWDQNKAMKLLYADAVAGVRVLFKIIGCLSVTYVSYRVGIFHSLHEH